VALWWRKGKLCSVTFLWPVFLVLFAALIAFLVFSAL
jgi:hypothetical protein